MTNDELQDRVAKAIADAAGHGMREKCEKMAEAAIQACYAAMRGEDVARDAARYRWLREHFRFANDSLREIWFDAHTQVNQLDAKYLDDNIDAAMGERHG